MYSLLLALLLPCTPQVDDSIEKALERAEGNRVEIEAAYKELQGAERAGLDFLVRHMPDGDLKSLSRSFLVEHVRYAYKAWNAAPWRDSVNEEYFFNNVLPYASINERRDSWRKDFYERFSPLVSEAKTPSEATQAFQNAQDVPKTLQVEVLRHPRRTQTRNRSCCRAPSAACLCLLVAACLMLLAC